MRIICKLHYLFVIKELHCTTVFIVLRSCLFICSVLGTHPISCAICVSVAICIHFHRKKKKSYLVRLCRRCSYTYRILQDYNVLLPSALARGSRLRTRLSRWGYIYIIIYIYVCHASAPAKGPFKCATRKRRTGQ